MPKNLSKNKNNSKKREEREQRYDDSYIPGAHFHNWING